MRNELLKLFERSGAFRTGDFELASGEKSDCYVDCRLLTLDGNALNLIGLMFLDLLKSHFEKVPKCYGGTTSGADPIVASLLLNSLNSRGFFVRKETKDHGMKRRLEGHCPEGCDVVVFDDVATSGGSAQIAVDAARGAGANVVSVCVIVDREEGARRRFEDQGIKFFSLVTLSELKNFRTEPL